MIKNSVDKLEIYLRNKGFYHADVSSFIKYTRRKASVTYRIKSGLPCIVDEFKYNLSDTSMLGFILSDTASGKLRKGMIYDTYTLDDERDRIANLLKNNSYYNFSLSDIYYLVDTTNSGLSAKVEMNVKKIRIKIPGTNDSTSEIPHPRFYIKNIYFTPNADISSSIEKYDTLKYTYRQNKADTALKTIYIRTNNEVKFKPSFLISTLQFSPGDPYNQSKANRTYKNLISQPIIASTNINMAMHNDSIISPGEKQWLDCNIRLTRNRPKVFNIGTEGTNSGGRFGLGVNTSVQNRNLLKGAEVFSLKVGASAELQGSLNNQTEQSEKYFLFFSTIQGGAEANIDFPRILLPYRSKYQENLRLGRTSLSAGIGFEYRPEYKRNISTAALSYKWSKIDLVKHTFTPMEVNYIDITTSSDFQSYLDSLSDPQYKSQYTDHLLTMIRYSFAISNMGLTRKKTQFFLRFNAETSGNMLYIADNIFKRPETADGYYERLNVRYAQYARFDLEYRKYWKMRFSNSLAFRFLGGIGIPYGNSESVPFEKSFWLGGANDMRGWRLRTLGPGAYSDSTQNFDKTGDIILQASIEQRFPIYSFILGSVFIDAGNVWLRKPSPDFPGGEFKIDSFYKQIALNLGLGLRFDFSFFIFRIDGAVPFKNPANDNGWFNKDDFQLKNSVLNFGIGYPF
jgi:outer membrane protein assembly factor BamA